MQAEYQAGSDRNRAQLQAGLLNQGFQQAQQAAQQQFQNQQGLAQLVPGLQGTDISRLGSLGALNQAQTQAGLEATRQANQMAAYQVDGLSGATLTSRGVTNMLVYWFGESGYKETLNKINYDS